MLQPPDCLQSIFSYYLLLSNNLEAERSTWLHSSTYIFTSGLIPAIDCCMWLRFPPSLVTSSPPPSLLPPSTPAHADGGRVRTASPLRDTNPLKHTRERSALLVTYICRTPSGMAHIIRFQPIRQLSVKCNSQVNQSISFSWLRLVPAPQVDPHICLELLEKIQLLEMFYVNTSPG